MDDPYTDCDLADALSHRELADEHFGAGAPHDEDFPLETDEPEVDEWDGPDEAGA